MGTRIAGRSTARFLLKPRETPNTLTITLSATAFTRMLRYSIEQSSNPWIRDEWCQNETNVEKPKFLLPPHTAPLDLLFYYGTSFPNMQGDAFVALHGSWNRFLPPSPSLINIATVYPQQDTKLVGLISKTECPYRMNHSYHHCYQNLMAPILGSTAQQVRLFDVICGHSNLSKGLAVATCHGVECLLITSDYSNSIIALVRESSR